MPSDLIRCPRCGINKERNDFGTRVNRMRRKYCKSCEEHLARKLLCHNCGQERPLADFPPARRRKVQPVCGYCDPPKKGKRATKKLMPYTKYWCKGCSRSLSPDWFDVKTMRGEKWVVGDCRACKREAEELERTGRTTAEQQLRLDMIYDFDLARNMFGMSYDETVVWLENGYGVNEDRMRMWGMTETRRTLWEPDPCD